MPNNPVLVDQRTSVTPTLSFADPLTLSELCDVLVDVPAGAVIVIVGAVVSRGRS